MCGIFGALSFGEKAIDAGVAERMSAQVARRGPDDRGEVFDGPVMLGHRRLAIIDLSPAGHQPMTEAEERYTIVFNGTIYNYPELREDLIARGYRFNSHSDTEVILNAYACWGADAVARLHGMFAFAIWDRQARELFLARDQVFTQFRVVVYRAVEHERVTLLGLGHRLVAGRRQVDDRETTVAEHHGAVEKLATIVGPAPRHLRRHAFRNAGIDCLFAETQGAKNTAHNASPERPKPGSRPPL